MTLDQQKSGERVYDINTDGMAHYGLYPDWIEDLRMIAGDQIVKEMGRGAEAYLEMWERAEGIRPAYKCAAGGGRFTSTSLKKARLGQTAPRLLKARGKQPLSRGRAWKYCVREPRTRRRGARDRRLQPPRPRGADRDHRPQPPRRRRPGARPEAAARRSSASAAGKGNSFVYGVRDGRVRYVALASKGDREERAQAAPVPASRGPEMRQLTSLDAQFLALETPRQTGHVGGVAILDPSTAPGGMLDCSDMKRLLEERLPLLPPFRWRLAEVPLGLDYPYWIDDPDFDLDFHVRELALPAPGSDQQLGEQVARIFARPLDRARPLWELYVIHGLESGHVAALTKIHHALIDGMSGAEIMGLLLDLEPTGRELPPPPEQRARGEAGRPRDARPRPARAAALSAARAPVAAARGAEPRGHAVRDAARRRHGRAAGRRARGVVTGDGASRSRCAEDLVQRARLAAQPLRLRPARARRRQGGRRTRTGARSTTSSSRCARASCGAGWSSTRAAGRAARGADPGLGRGRASRPAPTATGSC